MKQSLIRVAILSALSLAGQQAQALTATLYFDYVATNADSGKGGSIALGTGGKYTEVAKLTITDLADLGVKGGTSSDGKRTYSNGGVRVTLTNLNSNNIFGSSANAATAIGSFELNFPDTKESDTDFNNNYANWGNNSGVKMAFSTNPDNGGVEWQEDGCTITAIAGSCTTAENSTRAKWDGWGQQFNYGGGAGTNVDSNNSPIAFTQGQSSTFDIYNPANANNISVLKLLANPIKPTGGNGSLPLGFGWVNPITGIPNSTDPNSRAVAANGWWGSSVNSAVTTSTNNRVQVLATSYSLGNSPKTSTSVYAECLFNALENDSRYQSFLLPKAAATGTYQSYTYRYYSQAKGFLGISSDNLHIYYLDASNKMWDLTQSFGWTLESKLAEYKCN